jgi:arginine decarboxylase
LIPQKFFLTKGVGFHHDKLQSFELALRDAKIEKYNIVKVSSILPPKCEEISEEEGLKLLKPGQIIYVVMSKTSSNELNRLISAAIGVAKPADNETYGYLSEYHVFGIKPEKVADQAEDLAATMLATTLGIEFDPDLNYDERREIYYFSGKIVESKNITATATVKEENEWTTVIAVAVFII